MKLTQKQLRKLISEEISKGGFGDETHASSDARSELIWDIVNAVGETLQSKLMHHFSPQHMQRNTIQDIVTRVEDVVRDEVSKLT